MGVAAMTKPETTEYQDERRDEMLDDLLQMIGWYKLALPSKESFQRCLENFKVKHHVEN